MLSIDINSNNLLHCLCLVWIMSQGSSVVTTRREHVRSPVLNKMSFLPISPRAAMIFKLLFQWQTLLLRKRGGLPPLGCYCSPSRPPRPTAPSSPNLTASPLCLSQTRPRSFRSRLQRQRNPLYMGRRCVHGQKQRLKADRYIFFLNCRQLGEHEKVLE